MLIELALYHQLGDIFIGRNSWTDQFGSEVIYGGERSHHFAPFILSYR